jgi:hypothetical protein
MHDDSNWNIWAAACHRQENNVYSLAFFNESRVDACGDQKENESEDGETGREEEGEVVFLYASVEESFRFFGRGKRKKKEGKTYVTTARKLDIVPSNSIQYAAFPKPLRKPESRNGLSGIKLLDSIV